VIRRAAFALGAIVVFGVLVVLHEVAVRSLMLTSDQTVILLQAHSVDSGNLLLRGWHLPSDDFLTLTVAAYAVGELFTGVNVSLITVMAPLLYALMVTLMVLISASGLPRRAAAVAGLVTLLVLGLPAATGPLLGINVLLTEHVETVSAVVAAWLLFHAAVDTASGHIRAGRWRWMLALLSGILLLAAAIADPFVIFLLVVPVLLLSGVEWARRRNRRYYVTLAAWAVGAGVLGTLIGMGVSHLGGYQTVRLALHPAGPARIIANAQLFVTYLSQVTGADALASGLDPAQRAFSLVRLALLLFTVYAVLRTLTEWVLRREIERVAVVVSLACVVLSAAIIVSQEFDTGAQRYLEVLAIVAAPVAAIRIGRWTLHARRLWQPVAVAALLAVACAGSFAPALTSNWSSPYPTLAAWLQQRGLSDGVSDYWYAAMISSQSGAAVTVVPVFLDNGGILPQLLLADSRWLQADAPPSGQWFALWPNTDPLGGIDQRSTAAAFGPPAATYTVSGFTVAVWNEDIIADVNKAYAAAPPGSVPPEPDAASEAS
jgi:hypothetical protein